MAYSMLPPPMPPQLSQAPQTLRYLRGYIYLYRQMLKNGADLKQELCYYNLGNLAYVEKELRILECIEKKPKRSLGEEAELNSIRRMLEPVDSGMFVESCYRREEREANRGREYTELDDESGHKSFVLDEEGVEGVGVNNDRREIDEEQEGHGELDKDSGYESSATRDGLQERPKQSDDGQEEVLTDSSHDSPLSKQEENGRVKTSNDFAYGSRPLKLDIVDPRGPRGDRHRRRRKRKDHSKSKEGRTREKSSQPKLDPPPRRLAFRVGFRTG